MKRLEASIQNEEDEESDEEETDEGEDEEIIDEQPQKGKGKSNHE